jgi:hypothetical protein
MNFASKEAEYSVINTIYQSKTFAALVLIEKLIPVFFAVHGNY